MQPPTIPRLMFIDVEASGLGPGSWPIEVGWSWIDEAGTVQSDAVLIQPDPDWALDAWTPQAEQLHGITLDHLREHGVLALSAARQVRGLLVSAEVISDNAVWDQRWLRVLLEVLPMPAPALVVRDRAWLEQQHPLSRAGTALLLALWASAGKAHRALPDAEDLARAWQRVLAYEAEPQRQYPSPQG